VLINKAMIEIPPKFAGRPPIHPDTRRNNQHQLREWKGAGGLAEDVRRYGQWMRDAAEKHIGHLYRTVKVSADMAKDRPDLRSLVGQELTVIAWLWVRTVKSPNPAFADVDVPLASTFTLATKPGKEAYVEPVIENGGYRFTVKVGNSKDLEGTKNGTKIDGRGANFRCLVSQTLISGDYVKAEGVAGRIGARLMAIVADSNRGRVYLPPTEEHSAVADCHHDSYRPTLELPKESKGRTAFWCVLYGLTNYSKLFTPRQLAALTTFSDLVGEAMRHVRSDAIAAGFADDPTPLRDGGTGSAAYAEAVGVYLAFAVDKMTDRNSSICGWDSSRDSIRGVFGRQAIPMTWDYAESHALGESAGSYLNAIDQCVRVLNELPALACGTSQQCDAASQSISVGKVVSTDPPYYDNIGYADLSDFFYVWLRRSLRSVFPELFATLAVPKTEELVATPYRHGGKKQAETFFLDGMTRAMHLLVKQAHSAFPVAIYYAFKQSETSGAEGTTSTGWETFLDAVIRAGFSISGTWPMRTELGNRMIGSSSNALASSIVLVCRPRSAAFGTISRRQFVRMLNETLPLALDAMSSMRATESRHVRVALSPSGPVTVTLPLSSTDQFPR
jgi:putative DNA methylase